MFKLSGLIAVVPISALLTVSFFVLVVIRKIEEKGLRAFGYVVTGFLWLAALVVFGSAAFGLGKEACGGKKYGKMRPEMGVAALPPQMMHPNREQPISLPTKVPSVQKSKSSSCSSCKGNMGIVTKSQ